MLAGPYGEVFARMYLKQPHPNYTRNEKERARKKRDRERKAKQKAEFDAAKRAS